jgi:hypothetical protein
MSLPVIVLALFLAPVCLAHDTDEMERLRRELDDARREIRVLREENARLRGLHGAPESARDDAGPEDEAGAQRSLPRRDLATPGSEASAALAVARDPIEEGSLVSADQLLAECATSLRAAEARYRGRRFRVAGIATVFAKTFTEGLWKVQLKGTDVMGVIRCDVRLPGFLELRLSSDGSLIGRRDARSWETLMGVGEEAIIEGTFARARDDGVLMKNCELVTSRSAR